MRRTLVLAPILLCLLPACRRSKTFSTKVELTRVYPIGRDPKAPTLMDVELRYSECPGDARKLVRGDKEFAACALGKLKTGMKDVPVEVVQSWNAERGNWRGDVVQIGGCAIKADPKDEANYERIEVCSELKVTGVAVGVTCDRKRGPALVEKCPWLRRD